MEHAQEFPIEKMCTVLGVSRSGFYDWRKAGCRRGGQQHELDQAITAAFDKSEQRYGSPRVVTVLESQGLTTSAATVARRMRHLNLVARRPPRRVFTTDSSHSEALSANLLERDFTAAEPATKYVSDITYVAIGRQWAYLTVVIDLADRAVVGWCLSDNMTATDTTVAAFNQMVDNRRPKPGAIFHSDRGSQYACQELRQQLETSNCIQSMSRKGNCWDNAVAESFFKTIKSESLNRHYFETIEEARRVIFRYIDGFYNTRRYHTTLGQTPAEAYYQLCNLPALAA